MIGRERVPKGAVLAAKHHSWHDGFAIFAQFDDLAFVCGDHLLTYPVVGALLRRLGAIVISSKGGAASIATLMDGAAAAGDRPILIFPEGHLSPVGTYHRYRGGVARLQEALGRPIVPVATNLGVFAPLQDGVRRSGVATLQFLQPIEPGRPRGETLGLLQRRLESHSNLLIAEALGEDFTSSREIESAKAYFESLTAADLAPQLQVA